MNREHIIKLAREAGLIAYVPNAENWAVPVMLEFPARLERFAALVARDAVAAERDAANAVLRQAREALHLSHTHPLLPDDCADAIAAIDKLLADK